MKKHVVLKILKQTLLGYDKDAHTIIANIQDTVVCDDGKTYRCQHSHHTSRITGRTNIGDFENFTKIDGDE